MAADSPARRRTKLGGAWRGGARLEQDAFRDLGHIPGVHFAGQPLHTELVVYLYSCPGRLALDMDLLMGDR